MGSPSSTELREGLVEVGTSAGLDEIGFCAADIFADVRATLHERKAQDLHNGMQFTYRNPDRSTDPCRALPEAKSLVVGAIAYRRKRADATDVPSVRVGEYVWEPHYERLRHALNAVAERLRSTGHKALVLVDDNALVDRAAAHRAGIGWWGKNSNILLVGKGSRFVLGSVVTTAALEPKGELVADGCGSCRRCIDACPTNAIVADGVIDSHRCLAWLVQKDGVFPREYRAALGDRIYGCDDCQASCPPNVLHDRRDTPDVTTGQTDVPLDELLTLDDEELMRRFGAWYIPRRDPNYLRRNALIALGNSEADQAWARQLLQPLVASSDEIVRSHALWAAAQLELDDLVTERAGDGDIVREELAALSSGS